MPSFRRAVVAELAEERPGLQRLVLDDGSRAYGLTELVGTAVVGDELLVNTTAVDRSLGTGGSHVVHTNLSRPHLGGRGPGHIMKARYLAEQADTGSWEEAAGELSDRLPDLTGTRVALCVLHSHVGALAAGVAALDAPAPAYVMTDQSALPMALSDLVADLVDRGLLAATITAGQSFGGSIEAVNVASGVHAAQRDGHRSVIVAGGPGHVGTGSAIGFSSLDLVGHAAVLASLGAQVALVVRASSSEERSRHLEISHHTTTLLDLCPVPVEVPVPAITASAAIDRSWITSRGHRVAEVAPLDLAAALERLEFPLTTMGRSLVDDRLALAYLGAGASWLSDGSART